jgi:hypothetical protein
MAAVTESIGTATRDWSTITLWEADLVNKNAADDITGECYDDSTFDEAFTMNDATPTSVTLSVEANERHDGTAGIGARLVATAARLSLFSVPSGMNGAYTIEWLEFDANGNGGPLLDATKSQFNNVGTLKNLIMHDQSGGFSYEGLIMAETRDVRVMNCILYDNTRSTTVDVWGISVDGDKAGGGVYNNTVYKCDNSSSGDAEGIYVATNSANHTSRNNISVGHTSSSGTANAFVYGGTNIDSDYNLSDDATADDAGGSNHVINTSVGAVSFVSTANGNEDLHLSGTGSSAHAVGEDLVTTPSGVEIDIDGTDRDANGDTWDIGAHLYIAAAGGSTHHIHLPLLGVG